jgi:hypothetical protein
MNAEISGVKIDATVDIKKSRSIGMLITLNKDFFTEHVKRNEGYGRHDDIVFRVETGEYCFSFDEFTILLKHTLHLYKRPL